MRAIEMVSRTWVEDARGNPVYVRRVLLPLMIGYAPDGRPDCGPAGPQPLPGDGAPRHGSDSDRVTTNRKQVEGGIVRQLAGGRMEYMPCEACGSTSGFGIEWASHQGASTAVVELMTALIECCHCAHVMRGGLDAAQTVAGCLIEAGELDKASDLVVRAQVRYAGTPSNPKGVFRQGKRSLTAGK